MRPWSRFRIVVLTTAFAALAGSLDAQPPPDRPTVAVLDFDYATVREQFLAGANAARPNPMVSRPVDGALDVGRGIADLVVDELIKRGDVRVIERKRLADVLNEQRRTVPVNAAALPVMDPEHLSKLLGARYLIMGSVTKFGGEEKIRGGFLSLIPLLARRPLLGLALGSVALKDSTARVGLSCRLVDVLTAEVLGSARADGKAKRKGLALGGFASRPSFAGTGSFSIRSSDFQSTILGEATVAAVTDIAGKLQTMIGRLTTVGGAARP